MSMLLLQTFLLMLTAFFLGALVACLIKSTFFDTAQDTAADVALPRDVAVAQAQAARPQPLAEPGATLSPAPARPVPEPVRPKIETVVRPAASATAPAPEAQRFERALKEQTSAVAAPAATVAPAVPAASPVAPAKPPVAAPVVTAPAVAAPFVTPTVVKPVVTTPVTIKPAAPVSVAPPAAGQPAAPAQPAATNPGMGSAVGASAAAAAAAAIAATQMRSTPPAQVTQPAPVAPPPVMPVAAGATGQSSVAAEVSMKPAAALVTTPAAATVAPAVTVASVSGPAAAPLPAEDLTRIRGIDHTMQARLNGFGIRRYEEIAAWKSADVQRVSTALGIGGLIGQENWIEQAQVLAKGGETDYARKQALARLAVATPTANEGTPLKPAEIASAAPRATSSAATAAPGAASPGTFTSVPFGQAPRPSPPIVSVEPAPVMSPAAKPAAPVATSTPAPAPATMELPRTGAQAAAAAAAAIAAAAAASSRRSPATDSTPAAAPVPAAKVEMRDDLQRIAGINAEVEKLLNVQGVTRFAHIAAWNSSDTERFTRLLGTPGRIARENWIEQAAVLAGGGATYTRRDDVQTKTEAEAPRPARLADAIRERESVTKPEDAGRAPLRTDLSNLRSVRSEALRGDQPAVAGGIDDLKRIRGIGVLIEKKLNSLGITGYEQVANWTGADIDRVSQILDFKGRIERENWVEQARILASGGQTEFSRRVDKGDV